MDTALIAALRESRGYLQDPGWNQTARPVAAEEIERLSARACALEGGRHAGRPRPTDKIATSRQLKLQRKALRGNDRDRLRHEAALFVTHLQSYAWTIPTVAGCDVRYFTQAISVLV